MLQRLYSLVNRCTIFSIRKCDVGKSSRHRKEWQKWKTRWSIAIIAVAASDAILFWKWFFHVKASNHTNRQPQTNIVLYVFLDIFRFFIFFLSLFCCLCAEHPPFMVTSVGYALCSNTIQLLRCVCRIYSLLLFLVLLFCAIPECIYLFIFRFEYAFTSLYFVDLFLYPTLYVYIIC